MFTLVRCVHFIVTVTATVFPGSAIVIMDTPDRAVLIRKQCFPHPYLSWIISTILQTLHRPCGKALTEEA